MRIKTFFICLFLLISNEIIATPSGLFWTPCSTSVLPEGMGHIDDDNFFTVFNRRGRGSIFAPDIGFLLGFFNWNDVAFEAGIDYLGGRDDPIYFNAKLGIEENKLFNYAPTMSIGILNVGTRKSGFGRTNQDILDIVVGKTLPSAIGGKLYLGGFSGRRAMGKNRQGFMVGYINSFCPARTCDGKEYFKWAFAADYATGKNTLGGGGFSFLYYFTPYISIQSGPVFFNSAKINGTWKWSVQIDISFQAFDKKLLS